MPAEDVVDPLPKSLQERSMTVHGSSVNPVNLSVNPVNLPETRLGHYFIPEKREVTGSTPVPTTGNPQVRA